MLTPSGILVLLVLLGIAVYFLANGERSNLDRDLIQAAGGDKKLAKRMIERAKLKYPDKSESWYVEKVIYDLGRDRGVVKTRGGKRVSLGRNKREVRDNLLMFGAVLWVANLLSRTFDSFFH
ncbi:MAG: hypothetical protein AAFX40_09800 [Cyanobacteria bacterium J06639_1]